MPCLQGELGRGVISLSAKAKWDKPSDSSRLTSTIKRNKKWESKTEKEKVL